MRVIAGICRSMPLRTVDGAGTRPTTDRIKETLFNILQTDIPGCRFLDLFAGSGGVGIEALSRGAGKACFVDSGRKAIRVIEENLRFTKLLESAEVLHMDALSAIRYLDGKEQFDIIFMDPPYRKDLEKDALEKLEGTSLLAEDGIVIIEASDKTDISWIRDSGFELYRKKNYKTNMHLFLRRNRPEQTEETK